MPDYCIKNELGLLLEPIGENGFKWTADPAKALTGPWTTIFPAFKTLFGPIHHNGTIQIKPIRNLN